jgi:hypothetical protein
MAWRSLSPSIYYGSFALPSDSLTLTDYWTDFESENGVGKVLPLATILVQGFLEQRYSLIRTESQSPDNRALTDYWTDFESENGFGDGIATGYNIYW